MGMQILFKLLNFEASYGPTARSFDQSSHSLVGRANEGCPSRVDGLEEARFCMQTMGLCLPSTEFSQLLCVSDPFYLSSVALSDYDRAAL